MYTLGLVVFLTSFNDCIQWPLGPLSNSTTIKGSPIVGETVIISDLSLKANTDQTYPTKLVENAGDETRTPSYMPVAYKYPKSDGESEEESDFPNDEFDRAYNYLKNTGKKNELKVKALALPPDNPIYITVPIYINTSAKLPINLSVGGQSIPMNPNHEERENVLLELSPTSQFNRLLNYEELLKKTSSPLRNTNRHRSNFQNKMNM